MKLRQGDRCTYCGLPATERDHVIPWSYAGRGPKRTFDEDDCVPACRECNALAGAKIFESLEEKADYIQFRLAERYKRLVKTPFWTEEQVTDLGPSLRRSVVVWKEAKDIVEKRLKWPVPYEIDANLEKILRQLGSTIRDKRWLRLGAH